MLDLVATIEAVELPAGQLVVSAHGSLDGRSASELSDTLIPLAAAEAPVFLDLTDAHGLDDGSFAVVARAAHLVRCRTDTMRIVTQSPSVMRLIEESGLDDIVAVHPTLAKALDA